MQLAQLVLLVPRAQSARKVRRVTLVLPVRKVLPAQTVLAQGEPYHEPMRLITVIEAPFKRVIKAIDRVSVVRRLLVNGWIRMMIIDPESGITHLYDEGEWQEITVPARSGTVTDQEAIAI